MKNIKGVTFIELMVTLVVLGVLVFLALPSYTIWMQNTQIRTAGEGILSGLTLARTEAARRNTSVELRMDAASGWTVCTPNCPASGPPIAPAALIQSRTAQEGTAHAVVTITPGGADRVTFSGLGRVGLNSDGSAPITAIKVDSTRIPTAESRELCVMVNATGLTRMCDPQVAAGDTRACVPAVPAGCL
ncbi:MAG: GspH/FimT family pseudopilin [Betaproteobacteria bacterium]|nr:GspH/FimT family pseudopilin [Betaproteobacteria bacterium]MDH3437595.1 GspH/FimT family pseudopilin [Betaproteobacteria bacterium]